MTPRLPARRITSGDTEWPTQLEDLGREVPGQLWLSGAGSLRLLALRSVAIVGARAATPYGMAAASALAGELAAAGWVVVSGAAYGIDSAAHRGALVAGGATVAVVAGGLEAGVPAARAPLMARIAANGTVVTEHPADVTPRKHSFLERNRLIAALTRAVVVVEAGVRSGSLNTARWAESLLRPVLAVPGPITSPMSAGTHRLIRNGRGILVDAAADILEVIEPLGSAPAFPAAPVDPSDLGGRVLAALGSQPMSLDCLAGHVRHPGRTVLAELLQLRDQGRVRQSIDGWCAADRPPAPAPP